MSNTFIFPADANGVAGAVRPLQSGTAFVVPAVLYATDGETPFLAGPSAPGFTKNAGTVAFAFENLTVNTAVLPLSSGVYLNATQALVQVVSGAISFRIDGGAPTSSLGHQLNAPSSVTLTSSHDIQSMQMVQTGSATGSVMVTYST